MSQRYPVNTPVQEEEETQEVVQQSVFEHFEWSNKKPNKLLVTLSVKEIKAYPSKTYKDKNNVPRQLLILPIEMVYTQYCYDNGVMVTGDRVYIHHSFFMDLGHAEPEVAEAIFYQRMNYLYDLQNTSDIVVVFDGVEDKSRIRTDGKGMNWSVNVKKLGIEGLAPEQLAGMKNIMEELKTLKEQVMKLTTAQIDDDPF
jgi:hypothetical protein